MLNKPFEKFLNYRERKLKEIVDFLEVRRLPFFDVNGESEDERFFSGKNDLIMQSGLASYFKESYIEGVEGKKIPYLIVEEMEKIAGKLSHREGLSPEERGFLLRKVCVDVVCLVTRSLKFEVGEGRRITFCPTQVESFIFFCWARKTADMLTFIRSKELEEKSSASYTDLIRAMEEDFLIDMHSYAQMKRDRLIYERTGKNILNSIKQNKGSLFIDEDAVVVLGERFLEGIMKDVKKDVEKVFINFLLAVFTDAQEITLRFPEYREVSEVFLGEISFN